VEKLWKAIESYGRGIRFEEVLLIDKNSVMATMGGVDSFDSRTGQNVEAMLGERKAKMRSRAACSVPET
jgi:hypothetical protein